MRRIFKKIFKKNTEIVPKHKGEFFEKISKILGFEPQNLEFYNKAFTHRSVNKIDDQGRQISYERLEFLGDSILGCVIAIHLYKTVPTGDEGYLTKMRSKIVSREHLNELGRDFQLIQFVESKVSSQHFGENIHGNIFEALIGAIYLDQGFVFCEKFIYERIINQYVDIDKLEGKVISYKSLIIEWCQKEKKSFKFESFEDEGKETIRFFGVKFYINEELIAKARATSKKKAEEKAAHRAYFVFQDKINKI